MKPLKIFISSVQKEFAAERKKLAQYIREDALLGTFFEVLLFEEIAANSHRASNVYLTEVAAAQIYLGIMGNDYGYEDSFGVSPVEHEFDEALKHNLQKWIYIKGQNDSSKHPKQQLFINRVNESVSRKRFSTLEELKKEVYNSCILYLKQTGKIESKEFDASLNEGALLDDIDAGQIKNFILLARLKRNFPLQETAPVKEVLSHLNLWRNHQLTNSALLAFGKNPQRFFPSATVKCAHFHGTAIEKPIPDYKEFGGTVFEMAEHAVDFVLSKISLSTGTRDNSNKVSTTYEIPRRVIAEAIINAIAHRNYFSKASVQVSVLKDRIEVFNPGKLPIELELADLSIPHGSYPHNPLLANCMFLTGHIERFGTGTLEIFNLSEKANLTRPLFQDENGFKVILYRPWSQADQVTDQVNDQVSDQVPDLVKRLIILLEKPLKSSELMKALDLKHRPSFRENYLNPALTHEYIEMTDPNSPTSPKQQYRLTAKGRIFLKKLKNGNK